MKVYVFDNEGPDNYENKEIGNEVLEGKVFFINKNRWAGNMFMKFITVPDCWEAELDEDAFIYGLDVFAKNRYELTRASMLETQGVREVFIPKETIQRDVKKIKKFANPLTGKKGMDIWSENRERYMKI